MYSETKKIANSIATWEYSERFDLSSLMSWDISIICDWACTWDIIIEKSFDWTNWYKIEGWVITLDWTEFTSWTSRSFTINTPIKSLRLKNTATGSTVSVYISYVSFT